MMRYVFLLLLLLNIATFGYYSFLHKPAKADISASQNQLINPVNATNVSKELPPMIGTKK